MAKTPIPGTSPRPADHSGSYRGGPASPAQTQQAAATGIRSNARGSAGGSEEPAAYLDVVCLLDLGLDGGRVHAQHVVVARILHHFGSLCSSFDLPSDSHRIRLQVGADPSGYPVGGEVTGCTGWWELAAVAVAAAVGAPGSGEKPAFEVRPRTQRVD